MLRYLVSALLLPAFAVSVGAQDDPAPAGGEVPIYQDTGQEPIFETEFEPVGDRPFDVGGLVQTPDGRILGASGYVYEYHEETNIWEELYNWHPSPWEMLAYNLDIVLLAEWRSLWRSTDGGHSWTTMAGEAGADIDLTPWGDLATGGGWEEYGVLGPMYISSDGGESWRSGTWEYDGEPAWSSDAIGTSPSGTYVVGTVPTGLGYSHDDGHTWHPSNIWEYGRFSGESFAWVPNGPNGPRLLSLLQDTSEVGLQLYASENDGVTWERVGVFYDFPHGGAHFRNRFMGTPAEYAFSDGSIYIVTQYARIWESRDGGETWQLFLRAPEILEEEDCPTCGPITGTFLLDQDNRFWFGVSISGQQAAWVYRSVDPVPIASDDGPGHVEAPELLHPEDGGWDWMQGMLGWSEVPEAEEYRVQVAVDSTEFEEVVVDTLVSETTWEYFLEAGFYEWRVYAFDGTVRSSWSEEWSFEARFPVESEDGPAGEAVRMAVHPNPSSGLIEVELSLMAASEVSVSIFDTRGRQIAVLQDGAMSTGNHTLTWDSSEAAPGIYYIRARTPDGVPLSRSVVVAR